LDPRRLDLRFPFFLPPFNGKPLAFASNPTPATGPAPKLSKFCKLFGSNSAPGPTDAYPALGPVIAPFINGFSCRRTKLPPPFIEYGLYIPLAATVFNLVPAQPRPATFATLLEKSVGLLRVFGLVFGILPGVNCTPSFEYDAGDKGLPPLILLLRVKGIIYIYIIILYFSLIVSL
jgi:hypothetical protein